MVSCKPEIRKLRDCWNVIFWKISYYTIYRRENGNYMTSKLVNFVKQSIIEGRYTKSHQLSIEFLNSFDVHQSLSLSLIDQNWSYTNRWSFGWTMDYRHLYRHEKWNFGTKDKEYFTGYKLQIFLTTKRIVLKGTLWNKLNLKLSVWWDKVHGSPLVYNKNLT